MATSTTMTETRPLRRHPTQWRAVPGGGEPVANFVDGKSVHVVDVAEYDLYRSMLYGLGATGVSNKKMAGVDLIVHGHGEAPKAVRTKYPAGEYVRADAVLPLFHQEVRSFGDFVRALRRHGFTVRNPSDEGDPEFDYFEVPLVGSSLHETLLQYLGTSTFIRGFSANQTTPGRDRDAAYSEFVVPNTGLTWYYLWSVDAWSRVSAQRGEGDYPLEIKGPQLLTIAPVVWTESTGLYFHEHAHLDSVNGLFIQAGVDARTGLASGVAISRVWT
jgi:hypothetical protein